MNRTDHDRHPSFTHDRSSGKTFDQRLYVPGTYDRPDKPCRLRVLWGEEQTNGLVNVIDENTTSEKPSAEGLLPPNEVLLLTTEQCRWLHRALGELVPRLDAADAEVARKLAAPCATCNGSRVVRRRAPYAREATDAPCPDCAGGEPVR